MINVNEPVDTVEVSELASYIRDTRRALIPVSVIPDVSFEPNVATNDAVFLDSDVNIWRRSLAGDSTRSLFYGIADVENASVSVYGIIVSSSWSFTPGQPVYVSNTDLGKLTSTDTGLVAGQAMMLDTLLIETQKSTAIEGLRADLTTLEGAVSDLEADLDESVTTLNDSINDAVSSLTENLTTHVDATSVHGATSSNEADRIPIRGSDGQFSVGTPTSPSHVTRLSDLQSVSTDLAAVETEVVNTRGDFTELNGRISAAIHPDGSLVTTSTAATLVEETSNPTYVSSSSFTVDGDLTGRYNYNRTVVFDSSTTSYVVSSSYDGGSGLTTVNVDPTNVPDPIVKLEYGFNPDEMPRVVHSDLVSILGADETDSDANKTKHVSNLQLKDIWDAIAAGSSGAFFNVKDYGAVGDGVTDDYDAIQDTIDACHAAGGGIVLLPPGVYKILTNDYWTLYSNITILGHGDASEIDVSDSSNTQYNGMFRADGALTGTIATPSVDIEEGDTEVTVNSSAGFTIGDLVLISSDETWSWGTFDTGVGELAIVREVPDGNTIILGWGALDSYATADNAIVTKVNSVQNISLENFKFTGRVVGATSLDSNRTATFSYGINIWVKNVTINQTVVGVVLKSVLFGGMIGSRVIHDNTDSVTSQDYSFRYEDASSHIAVLNNYFRYGRHAVDQSFNSSSTGISRNILIANNKMEGYFSGAIATHAGCEDLRILDNNISGGIPAGSNSPHGIEANAGRAIISGNIIRDVVHGIKSTYRSSDLIITDNSIRDYSIGIYIAEYEMATAIDNIQVTGNRLTKGKTGSNGISINFDTNGGEGLIVDSNVVDGGSHGINLNSSDADFKYSSVSLNIVRNVSGESLTVENLIRCIVSGNRTSGGTHGLRMTGASTAYNSVVNNISYGASTANITLTGSNNNTSGNLDGITWS